MVLLKKRIQTFRDGAPLDFIVVSLVISHQINSQMLRALVFTGVDPMISIESEEFGTNYHKDSSFSLLILSVLVELGDQYDWIVLLGMKQLEIHGKWCTSSMQIFGFTLV